MKLALAWSVTVLGAIAFAIWVVVLVVEDARSTKRLVTHKEHSQLREWIDDSSSADSLDRWSDPYIVGPSAYALTAEILLRDSLKVKP